MSQAEELLNQMTEGITTTSISPTIEEHIVISNDRVISVPPSLRKIAVQYDHDIETVVFDCPRYWDGHDLSSMVVYINYMTPNNSPGCYRAKNVKVDATNTSMMHFEWTISRNVTRAKGTLKFLVCIKKIDEEGNEQNHWNSELNQEMIISEGLECSETILDQHPDIITEILLRIDTLEVLQPEKIGTIITRLDDLEARFDEMNLDVPIVFANIPKGTPVGDVNNDGLIDSVDAELVAQYRAGTISDDGLNLIAADANGDGKIDTVDAMLIQQYIDGDYTGYIDSMNDINGVWYWNPNLEQYIFNIAVADITVNNSAVLIPDLSIDSKAFVKAECIEGAIRLYFKAYPIEDRKCAIICTDGDGSVIVTNLSTGSGGATEEQLAQIQKNADDIAAIPIKIADDGYTDFVGLRQATSVDITHVGSAIDVSIAYEGEATSGFTIVLDENGKPTSIVYDDIECALSWTGFDE